MKQTRAVLTRPNLVASLRELGVTKDGVLVVHASMSALGYVLHGAGSLLGALRDAIGSEGTLLVPAFTGEFTDPSCWVDPALPASTWDAVREEMPSFDKQRSMPALMGQLSLAVLVEREAERSDHPLCSWLALGPRAAELTADHDLKDPLGPKSPLGRALAADAQVLLLGVDQRRNAAFLHAHVRAGVPQARRSCGRFLVEVDGERRWLELERFVDCSEGYERIEHDLVQSGLIRVQRIGDSDCRLMQMRPLVHAVEHIIRTQPERVFCGRAGCRQCR